MTWISLQSKGLTESSPESQFERINSPVLKLLCGPVLTTRAFLVAQRLKRLPAVRETWVPYLDREIPWRRKWKPTPEFLPGESHGRRSLLGYSPRGHKEPDRTERLRFTSLSQPDVNTGKTKALTIWTFVGKVKLLLFNTLSKFVTAILPRTLN